MTNEQMLAEIREANLTYLMLAQSLIRQDRAEEVASAGVYKPRQPPKLHSV